MRNGIYASRNLCFTRMSWSEKKKRCCFLCRERQQIKVQVKGDRNKGISITRGEKELL